MSTYADVLRVALNLSLEERNALAEAMLKSLAEEPPDDQVLPALSDACKAEIARRSAEIDAGTAKSFSWEETKSRAHERAARNG